MSTQDKLERVLRDIHVMISRSELYDKTGDRIVVEKKLMFEHLNHLNACIYEMMDEYEATKQSRDRAEREAKKQGDQILWNASRSAEDVYAAAVLYTDEALVRAQSIMKTAEDAVKELLEKTGEELKQRREILRENQSELKSQLQDMVDTEKYLKIIDDRNKELEKEKREKEAGADSHAEEVRREKSIYEDRKTEIKINPAYFERMGLALEEAADREANEAAGKMEKGPQITVDLDSEYFKRKRGARKRQG